MTVRQTGGNSGTWTAVFADADGNAVDPDGAVTVTIYDAMGDVVGTPATIALADARHTATGTFQYTYTPAVPTGFIDSYDIAFSAEVGGEPQLGRVQVLVDRRSA